MRYTLLVVSCFLLGAVPLSSQEPDSDPPGRAGELLRQIEDRFAARVQEELGLTDQQAARMRDVVGGYFVKTARLRGGGERRLRSALAGELRPGGRGEQAECGSADRPTARPEDPLCPELQGRGEGSVRLP